MHTNKKALIFIAILSIVLFYGKSNGQSLKQGGLLPMLNIGNTYNYKSSTLALESLDGKAIIFDFWSPGCKGCLGSFKKLDALQRQFGDKIQIVLVNKQTRDSTARFFATRPFLYRPNLPFVTNDTLLSTLFPIGPVPAIAWIDSNRIFHKMTSEINVAAIVEFLDKNRVKPNTYVKRATSLNTLFNTNFEDSITYHSYLSKQIYGVKLNSTINERNGIVATNTKLWSLYVKAFEENGRYDLKGPKQVVFPLSEVENRNLSIFYNYSLQLPSAKKAELYKTMQEDLRRNFNYDVSVEMRATKALVLVSTDGKNRMATKGGEPKYSFHMNDEFSTNITPKRILNNQPMKRFVDALRGWVIYKLKMPFVNEVQYTGNIDVIFDGNIVDNLTLEGLKGELNRYGLDVVEKEIKQWTLVFK